MSWPHSRSRARTVLEGILERQLDCDSQWREKTLTVEAWGKHLLLFYILVSSVVDSGFFFLFVLLLSVLMVVVIIIITYLSFLEYLNNTFYFLYIFLSLHCVCVCVCVCVCLQFYGIAKSSKKTYETIFKWTIQRNRGK